MDKAENYLSINKAAWNTKTMLHVNSDFYDMKSFMKGRTSLNEIELKLLGDIKNKRILHLQCHFGQDTISLGRMGAHVTGIDLSDKAIEKAKAIAIETNINADFICCDIYELPKYLDQKFDIIYTSYGVIGWLPDMDKWAKIISEYLIPGGQLVFVEFHPIIWMYNDSFTNISYDYFNSDAIIETELGTYADTKANVQSEFVMWNHSISEVLTSLLNNGMELNQLDEYDYSPYDCLQNLKSIGHRKYQFEHIKNRIPMVYSIIATKK